MKLAFIALVLAAGAARAHAGEVTFLGWEDHGIALARIPTAQCRCHPPSEVIAADGVRHELLLDDVPALELGLAPASETTVPTTAFGTQWLSVVVDL